MHDFNGRSRRLQITLARHYGFEDYAQPGGRLLLSHRQLADLWETRGERNYELNDIMLLKVGRHLRPRPYFKLIVGREEGENHYLGGLPQAFCAHNPGQHMPDDLELATRIAARFSKGRDAAKVTIEVTVKNGASRNYQVTPLPSGQIPSE
jgi:hypothetical protein